MNTTHARFCLLILIFGLVTGCDRLPSSSEDASKSSGATQQSNGSSSSTDVSDAAPQQPGSVQPGKPVVQEPVPPAGLGKGKKVNLGNNVHLEVLPDKKRVVMIDATICLREGMLEHLLCRKMTKEHESILKADIDAFIVHSALLAAGAEAGKPVQFDPKYQPAHGTTIKVWVQYKDKMGTVVTHLAQKWVRNVQTKKDLHYDWVFAGSREEKDPTNPAKKPYYMANNGDVICVSNFASSLLDLPVATEKDINFLDFEANTDRIPPEHTPVLVILEPVLKK